VHQAKTTTGLQKMTMMNSLLIQSDLAADGCSKFMLKMLEKERIPAITSDQ
jgi:hypothetical protein